MWLNRREMFSSVINLSINVNKVKKSVFVNLLICCLLKMLLKLMLLEWRLTLKSDTIKPIWVDPYFLSTKLDKNLLLKIG